MVAPLYAGDVNSAALSQNGWYSDDTRADGTGASPAGTNLKSPTLTAAPESGSGSALFDPEILAQLIFGYAPGTVPAFTHTGAAHLKIGPSGSGKSQISHRKDDGIGFADGTALNPSFFVDYSWMGDGPSSITASFKIGFKTSEFGSAPPTTRTGEGAWDKLLVYEPGNQNPDPSTLSDGLWHTENVTFTSGRWWIVDRTQPANTIATPMTLSSMAGSAQPIGSKTVGQIWTLISSPSAKITTVQFGIGSGNANGSVYVNQLETSFYRVGDTTTFGPANPYNQNVTPDVIYGAGNANGSYTVDRQAGVELGMRGKLRFPPSNIFNSNGDGTYTFNTGSGTSSPPNAEWAFDWSVNTNWNGTSIYLLDDLFYEIGMDFDPGPGTNYLVFDPITLGATIPYTTPLVMPFWDHSIGTNATPNGGGVEATSAGQYTTLLANNNVAQNSWRTTFFDEPPFSFNPNVNGRYEYYLSAFKGAARVAKTNITIFALDKISLTLDAAECQTTDVDPITPGTQIKFTLNVRNPDSVAVTGYQAFLEFDAGEMTFVAASSSYSASPFPLHITPISGALSGGNKLKLDGSVGLGSPAITDDALAATLVFTVNPSTACAGTSLTFDLSSSFASETSNGGAPYATDLLNSPTVVSDTTPPVITPVADIVQPSDAGSCGSAVVTFPTPTVVDNCGLASIVFDPPSGSVFPTGPTVVTVTATDDCGNQSQDTFTVTITDTVLVDVVVELQGSGVATRCINFVPNSCGDATSIPLFFSGLPATATATIEIPCGNWTTLCAKDQQHSQWDTTLLVDIGTKYQAQTTLVLGAGDTDDDGDVDINDVTLLIAQFGLPAANGGCPWNGVRNADFSNNGIIGTEDYSILSGSGNWLTDTSCVCSIPSEGPAAPQHKQRWVRVHDDMTRAADLNRDGRVDVHDVDLLERRNGLPNTLSTRMRQQ
ncbi:MAG: HYR domain-containing protein [Phycisphaerae bacterium]|nr:HYR domain-containing protein [Phycisphaerae bacterium]